jgi:hypothetical protein
MATKEAKLCFLNYYKIYFAYYSLYPTNWHLHQLDNIVEIYNYTYKMNENLKITLEEAEKLVILL